MPAARRPSALIRHLRCDKSTRSQTAIMADNDFHGYHAQGRRFHLALVTPSRMRPLLGRLESAWNVTEPFQPMTHIDQAQRAWLHAEHQGVLESFLARDGEAPLRVAGRHLDHLDTSIAALPVDTGMFSEPDGPLLPGPHPSGRRAVCS